MTGDNSLVMWIASEGEEVRKAWGTKHFCCCISFTKVSLGQLLVTSVELLQKIFLQAISCVVLISSIPMEEGSFTSSLSQHAPVHPDVLISKSPLHYCFQTEINLQTSLVCKFISI